MENESEFQLKPKFDRKLYMKDYMKKYDMKEYMREYNKDKKIKCHCGRMVLPASMKRHKDGKRCEMETKIKSLAN
jgi:hypothetical protein